jgi:hypothetical protein
MPLILSLSKDERHVLPGSFTPRNRFLGMTGLYREKQCGVA